jgi:hypothetical protein
MVPHSVGFYPTDFTELYRCVGFKQFFFGSPEVDVPNVEP